MSYYRMPTSLHEYDEGTTQWETDDGEEHELRVTYECWQRDEPRSYGDTTAYETVSDTELLELYVDDELVEYNNLVALWGSRLTEERVREAIG